MTKTKVHTTTIVLVGATVIAAAFAVISAASVFQRIPTHQLLFRAGGYTPGYTPGYTQGTSGYTPGYTSGY